VILMLLARPGTPVTDSSWPPILIVCALVVVVGGLVAAIVFLRRAREATRPDRKPLDG
jgi:uncharacterized integral membrane protein